MSVALTMTAESLASAHSQFEAALPAMDRAFRFLLRRYPRRLREEVLTEARAYTWAACHGLLERGKDLAAVGLVAIAANSCRAVKNGRSVGARRATGRGALDVFHPMAQRKDGFSLVSLDAGDDADDDSAPETWRRWLAEDRRVTPADEAAFRVDFAAWLDGLSPTKRGVAEGLAGGLEGVVVAQRLGLSPGRVSQVRAELERSWREFQGQTSVESKPTTVAREGATKRRGRPRLGDRDLREVATGPTS